MAGSRYGRGRLGKLLRRRVVNLGAIGATAVLAVAAVWSSGVWSSVLWSGVVLSAACAAGLGFMHLTGRVAAISNRVAALEKRVAAVQYHARQSSSTVGTVVGIRRELSKLRDVVQQQAELSQLIQASGQGQGAGQPKVDSVPGDPTFVQPRASSTIEVSHALGRLGADRGEDESSRLKLAALLDPARTTARQMVVVLAGDPMAEQLGEFFDVIEFWPNETKLDVPAGASHLFITPSGVAAGQWDAALNTEGTSAYLTLIAWMAAAKRRGVVVTVLGPLPGSHFVPDLMAKADIVLPDNLQSGFDELPMPVKKLWELANPVAREFT